MYKAFSDDLAEIRGCSETLFDPDRLLLMKVLYLEREARFRDLLHSLRISDGKLASDLIKLEKEKIVKRKNKNKRPTYEITEEGRSAFVKFAAAIRKVLTIER